MIQSATLGTEAIVASLRQIMPPTALIDVGIGRGAGAMHQWRGWDVPAAWLVDAEPQQLAWTEPLAAQHPGWRVHVATLAEADGQAPCYRASNPAESGLVPTSKLAALWPNLREEEHAERATTRLDTLLAGDGGLPEGAGWWLVVDCLPALRILQGATDTLERCSVLWLRTLLQPLPENEAGTTLEDLQAFLAPLGFRCVQASEGNHPALGDALFVRDWAQRLQPVVAELRAEKEERGQQFQRLESQLATQEAAAQVMLQENEAQAKIAATSQTQLDKLAAEKSELVDKLSTAEKARGDLAGKLVAVEKERAAANDALAVAQSEISARAGERDAQAKISAERQTKFEAAAKEKADLTDKVNALGKTKAELENKLTASAQQQDTTTVALKTAQAALAERTGERDAQAKLAVERQAKLEALAKEKTDLAGKFDALGKTKAEIENKLTASVQQQGKTNDELKTAQAALAERTAERDAQAKLAVERQAKLEILAKEKTELTGKLDTLSKAHAELKDQLAASVQQQDTAANTLKTAQAALAERTSERDAQTNLATERQVKIDVFLKEKSGLSTKLDGQTKLNEDLQARLNACGNEKTAITEKLAAADKAIKECTERSDTLQTQAGQLTKARDEQAKLASERANLITQLTGQRDNLGKESQSLKSEVQGKDAAIAKLNERISEQDHRERQLVEEIVRAEAQIELIKDLLLREGGL